MLDASSERRQFPRFRLSVPITLRGEEREMLGTGQTIDVSDGGALLLISSKLAPPIGSTVFAELVVPGSPSGGSRKRQVCSQARIVRHQSEQADKLVVAIQFVEPLELGLGDQ